MATRQQRQEAAHNVSVAGNTVAGTVGGVFGAAKLRDSYKAQSPGHADHFNAQIDRAAKVAQSRGGNPAKVRAAAKAIKVKHPNFKALVIASTTGGVAAGARKYSDHLDHRTKVGKSAFGVELGKAAAPAEGQPKRQEQNYDPKALREQASRGSKVTRIHDRSLRERTHQAVHPPPVRHQRVASTALHSMGYQRQTRRMEVAFNGRPDKKYTYRMKPKAAAEFQSADSKGRHYAKQVKGKYPDGRKVTVAGRARLFADPEPVRKSAFGVELVSKSPIRMLPERAARNVLYPAAHAKGVTGKALAGAKKKIVPRLVNHSSRLYDGADALAGLLTP